MKAFIFDPLWDELVTPKLLAQLDTAGVECIVKKEVAPLADCAALFEGDEERLLCMNPDYVGWKLSSDDYKNIPHLNAILTASTAFGWLDASYATEHGIPICNIRGFSSQAVAEWATMIMFNLARQVPRLIKDGFPLDYDKDYMKYRGVELRGKTVGIVGLGKIGTAIAARCEGLGMHVTYWSQNSRNDQYEYNELSQLLASADVIFPLMAINDETKQVLSNELLNTMKPSAMLIDMVEIVDEEHVATMVAEGKLFGFGFEAKPGKFNDYAGNVWAAPPYGWTTDNSMYGSVERWVENMVAASNNQFSMRING
jgi:phosphoglycerate dehydrogenase-like enzyme